MRQTKRKNEELSPKQYKNLRKLIILWFKTILHHRFKMVVNVLLISSLVFNGYILIQYEYLRLKKSIPAESIDAAFYQQHLSLMSVTEPSQNLFDRCARLEKQYAEDKQQRDETYYEADGEKLKREWLFYCINRIRKIVNIENRLEQHSIALHYINGNQTNPPEHEMTPSEQAEQETLDAIGRLNDMSNYYAKFLSNETYKTITLSTD